ncbi:MAG: efflux RND transporter periplasmic adaptor subunit, partial [Oceanicaulis sp.]
EAPFDGVVTQRMLDEGAIAAPGAPVLTLVEAGALEARIGLPAAEARAIEPGRTYELEIGGTRVTATARAATGVVSGARTVETVFDLTPAGGVEPGAVARLILRTELSERGFWAPLTALSEGRRGLWSVSVLVPEDGAFRLEPRPVEILHAENDRVYLSGAVEDGARFLSGGVHRVTPGQLVRPAEGA